MVLDVETPDPPPLHGPQDPGDYDAVEEEEDPTGTNHRREELAALLHDGAWAEAFEEWADHTYLTEAQFRAVLDLDLIDRFDFYWNPAAEDVGYRAPALPENPSTADDRMLGKGDIEEIEEELDALGRTVSEVVEQEYIHRDGDEFGYTWE